MHFALALTRIFLTLVIKAVYNELSTSAENALSISGKSEEEKSERTL